MDVDFSNIHIHKLPIDGDFPIISRQLGLPKTHIHKSWHPRLKLWIQIHCLVVAVHPHPQTRGNPTHSNPAGKPRPPESSALTHEPLYGMKNGKDVLHAIDAASFSVGCQW